MIAHLILGTCLLVSHNGHDYGKGLLISPPMGTHKQAEEVYMPWGHTDLLSVDPTSRQSARAFYFLAYMASEGLSCPEDASVSRCCTGTSSFLYDAAALLRVNYFRKMSGLNEVFLSEEHGEKCRAAALMMLANCSLNHAPSTDWRCFSEAGSSAAGRSNLGLGNTGASAVVSAIVDDGPYNKPVGHRRWLLYPNLRWVGTGSVIDTQVQCVWQSANAFWVIDDGFMPETEEIVDWETLSCGQRFSWFYGCNETEPEASLAPTFVSWPPEGYVPADLAFPRWSLSCPFADFGQASVVMTGNSGPIPLQVVHYDDRGYSAGYIDSQCSSSYGVYGDTAIVWEPVLPEMELDDGDASYLVEVSNIQTSKGPISHAYTVTLMSVGSDPYADSDEPALAWVYPSQGFLTRNTRVALFGRNLGAAGVAVAIGGQDAAILEIRPNAVLVEVAPQLEGVYDVVLSHPSGRRAVLNSAFSYAFQEEPLQEITCCGQTTRIAAKQNRLYFIKSYMGDWLLIALACLALARHRVI